MCDVIPIQVRSKEPIHTLLLFHSLKLIIKFKLINRVCFGIFFNYDVGVIFGSSQLCAPALITFWCVFNWPRGLQCPPTPLGLAALAISCFSIETHVRASFAASQLTPVCVRVLAATTLVTRKICYHITTPANRPSSTWRSAYTMERFHFCTSIVWVSAVIEKIHRFSRTDINLRGSALWLFRPTYNPQIPCEKLNILSAGRCSTHVV